MSTKKNILLVEDNERLRTNLLFMLSREGFEVKGAINGTEALEIIRQDVPDLIITDIMMPDMDGYTLVKNLRQISTTLSTPVIFLTAKTSQEDIRAGMLYGVDDYLTKPVDIVDLLATIRVRLERADNEKKKWMANLKQLQVHLASILPHELRTPLSGILGASSLLRNNTEQMTSDDVVDMYSCIEASARRLERIAENFLLYVQLQVLLEERHDTSEDKNENKPLYYVQSVKEHIEEIAAMCAQKYNRADDIHCLVNDTAVQCTVAHFTKVLYEVIDNAFQFSSKNTPINITTTIHDKNCIITITDAGFGMTNEQLQAIQEFPTVFKQFDRKKFEQQGIGMGLVLVHNILELYGGRMDVVSNFGHSTSVMLMFRLL